MKTHNTKFTLSPGRFEVIALPPELALVNGLVPLPAVLDLAVGEELVLCWLDRTPFVHELAAIRPLQLFLRCGLFRSDFGPLMWMLFYVPNPVEGVQPFASVECHLNPADPLQVGLWRRLAQQTHWHLALLGSGDKVVKLNEFENCFGLEEALDAMEETCGGMQVTDFMRAKQQFWDTYSMDDLYAMS